MATFKDLLLQIRYPYTAGVIGVMWLGTSLLIATDKTVDVNTMLITNLVATLVVAALGFSPKNK